MLRLLESEGECEAGGEGRMDSGAEGAFSIELTHESRRTVSFGSNGDYVIFILKLCRVFNTLITLR